MRSLKEIISAIAIVDENVRNEAIRQPVLFINAVRYRVRKMRERAAAASALEQFSAEYVLSLRAKKRGEKLTEGYFKGRLQKSVLYRQRVQELHRTEEREEFAKLILEAYRMRRDAIRIIADAQNYEGIKEGSEIERMEAHRKLSKKAQELYKRRRRIGD